MLRIVYVYFDNDHYMCVIIIITHKALIHYDTANSNEDRAQFLTMRIFKTLNVIFEKTEEIVIVIVLHQHMNE